MDVADIFNFFCSGEVQGGGSEASGGRGGDFLLNIPGGGRVCEVGGGRRGGAGRVFAGKRGGANFFFFGAEIPTK